MDKSLGQVAYEAYAEARDWKVVSGLSMPAWDEQTPDLRGAWERAAKSVMTAAIMDAVHKGIVTFTIDGYTFPAVADRG